MNHVELTDSLLAVHGAIAGVALVMFYAYSDRTDSFGASLKGVSDVMVEMRRRIAGELGKRLDPVFRCPGSVPSPLLDLNGDTYIEHPVNPVGSEAYREAIRDFLEGNSESMADYRSLTFAQNQWCFWTSTFSWVVLALAVWQIVTSGIIFLDKLAIWALPDGLNCVLSVPTTLAIITCVISVVCRFLYFHRMTRLRIKYGEL